VTSQAQRLRAAREAHRLGNSSERDRLVAESVAELQTASNDAERAACAHSLASFYQDMDEPVECEAYARLAVDWVRRSGSLGLLGNHLMFLALLVRDAGRLSEAVQYASEALPCYVQALGPDHGEVRYIASVLENLRNRLARAGAP